MSNWSVGHLILDFSGQVQMGKIKVGVTGLLIYVRSESELNHLERDYR